MDVHPDWNDHRGVSHVDAARQLEEDVVTCGNGETKIQVQIMYDYYPTETIWEITKDSNTTESISVVGKDSDELQRIDYMVCLDYCKGYTFKISDTYNDGFNLDENENEGEGFDFYYKVSAFKVNGDLIDIVEKTAGWSFTGHASHALNADPEMLCPSLAPSISSSPSKSNVPSAAPTVTGCSDLDKTYVVLELKTDDVATDTTWEIRDSSGAVTRVGNNLLPNKKYIHKFCLDVCKGYKFTIFDSGKDGMKGYCNIKTYGDADENGDMELKTEITGCQDNFGANQTLVLEADPYIRCLSAAPSLSLTPTESSSPSISISPSASPSLSPTPVPCNELETKINVFVKVDAGFSTKVYNLTTSNGEVLYEKKDFAEFGETDDTYCVSKCQDVTFELFDTKKLGFSQGGGFWAINYLEFNKSITNTSDGFWWSQSHRLDHDPEMECPSNAPSDVPSLSTQPSDQPSISSVPSESAQPSNSPTTFEQKLDSVRLPLVFNKDCVVSLNTLEDIQLNCSFTTTDREATKAEIVYGECAENVEFFENGSYREAQSEGVKDSKVEVNIQFADKVTAAKKNSGTFTEKFCIRSDVLLPIDGELVSVAAKKIDAYVQMTYSIEEGFSVSGIKTSAFEIDSADSSAVRTENVDAYRCDKNGNVLDVSTKVGDTLNICVATPDDDVTLEVTGLVLKDDSTSTTLSLPIVDSIPSFVTAVTELSGIDLPSGLGLSHIQVVSTLMTPSIFDLAGGKTLTASGTVDITYVSPSSRMLKETSRALQAEGEASFRVSFVLMEKELPSIARGGDEYNGASITSSAIATMSMMITGMACYLM